MSKRYPAVPDVGDTIESIAEATRALKLHSDIATGATSDEDLRFVRRGELRQIVREILEDEGLI